VSLGEVELHEIPPFLELSSEEFLERQGDREPGYHPTLRMDRPACPCLKADNSCQIYSVRPMQCRAWPFWSENLAQATWEGPVKACCPGVDVGPLHLAAEVARVARTNDEWYSN